MTAGTTLLVAWMLAPSSSLGAPNVLDPGLCAPDRNSFTLDFTNRYLQFPVGQQRVLIGSEQGQTVGLRITVLNATETLNFRAGRRVVTRVVEEREWADANGNGVIDSGENLIEVSLNYFAETQDDTVCYFGEAVDIFENGVIVSHEGSWRADARGNAPGIFMPANPVQGTTFVQEGAPGVAEDQATVAPPVGTVRVPFGTFTDTVRLREVNPLDGSRSTKIFAAGARPGIIRDDAVDLVTVTP